MFICADLKQLTAKLRQGVLAADLAFGTRAPRLDEETENQETEIGPPWWLEIDRAERLSCRQDPCDTPLGAAVLQLSVVFCPAA